MPPVLPAHCQMALKEWASVVHAFARGDQLVLIRKGGLIEPTSGFELASKVFLFYPTFEHQTVNFLRDPFRVSLSEVCTRKPTDGQVHVEWCGAAVSSTQTRDPAVIERLSPFHIYNQAFVTQRLKWQPDQPLVVCVVRVFRLPSPSRLPVASSYTGCKSWVNLEQAMSLDGAEPVLDDAAFDERVQQIRVILH